jgi:mono/diheme cytochrome c family protein
VRLILACALVVAACAEEKKHFPDAAIYADAAPPAAKPPPPLPPVEGASAGGGKDLFVKACASCHGASGRGDGPDAAAQRLAPTDLTHEGYLCRSTFGNPPIPSDADVEGALDRGTHKGVASVAALDAASRRSLTLYLKTLAPGFSHHPLPVLDVPPEPPDTPEDRAKGRVLFLSFGCWVCHGAKGDGDGSAAAGIAWNGVKLKSLRPLHAHADFLCGDSAERLYRTISLGMGGVPALMPAYYNHVQWLARPKEGDPTSWTKPLVGNVPDDEVARVRAFFEALPERAIVDRMSPAEWKERGTAFLWSLVHYVRSL